MAAPCRGRVSSAQVAKAAAAIAITIAEYGSVRLFMAGKSREIPVSAASVT